MRPYEKNFSKIGKYQNKNSRLWDELFISHKGNSYPHENLVKFVAFLSQKEHMKDLNALDIGFGCYPNLKMCYEQGYDVFGIEVSRNALNRTKAALRNMKIPFEGRLFTPPLVPYRDNKFNLIYSHQALYYNLDLEKAVSEIYRTLRPGGAIYITFFKPNHWYFKYSKKVTDDIAEWSDKHPTRALRGLRLRYFKSRAQLAKVFKQFKNVRIYEYGSDLLGVKHYMWIVTGYKKGDFRKFDYKKHYKQIGVSSKKLNSR
ncbi:MAG: class I SAM-dependent methyltransferase [Candidatus Omnitrophica bacterium]|nr:class I SAM-dependent methyltransferase [Candidatus Omnitrophota bacterium]MBU4488908.1 class I SAM-dependent methyltransferase [Candidatus Omnitrophota bacterium]